MTTATATLTVPGDSVLAGCEHLRLARIVRQADNNGPDVGEVFYLDPRPSMLRAYTTISGRAMWQGTSPDGYDGRVWCWSFYADTDYEILDGSENTPGSATEPEPFAVDSRVRLVRPHVLSEGGQTYDEAPNGIGSTATVVNRPGSADNRVRVMWDNGLTSVAHESCLESIPAERVGIDRLPLYRVTTSTGHPVDTLVRTLENTARRDDSARMLLLFTEGGGSRWSVGSGLAAATKDLLVAQTGLTVDEVNRLYGWWTRPETLTLVEEAADETVQPTELTHPADADLGLRVGRIRDGYTLGPGVGTTWMFLEQSDSPANPAIVTRLPHGTPWPGDLTGRQSNRLSVSNFGRARTAGLTENNIDALRQWYVPIEHIEWVDSPAVTEATSEADDEVTRLRAELEQARQAHRDDVQTIGNMLIEEAESREWCGEYDEVVESINSRISLALPERDREVQVELTVTVNVQAPGSYTTEDLRLLAIERAEIYADYAHVAYNSHDLA